MTDRNPLIIRSCCCSQHIPHNDKSAPHTPSSMAGFSNTPSPHNEINATHLNSLRSAKSSCRVDDLVSQSGAVVTPYGSHDISMDGEADVYNNRYIHLVNSSGHAHHGSVIGGTGGMARRDRMLTKDRKSESCFDLIGRAQYVSHLENERPVPRRKFSTVSTSGRESWSSSIPRPSSRSSNQSTRSKSQGEEKAVVAYLTPLQRKDRELKQIKKEVIRLFEEVDERDSLILSLKYNMDIDARSLRDESERRIAEMDQVLKENEKERMEKEEEIKTLKTQLEETEAKLAKVQLEQGQEKELFKDKYLDMYLKGQRAAAFEREEELEMLATKRKEKVTSKELARKLSRTETELAKWQTLRLDEAYHTPTMPDSNSEITLNFLKDSFYHFITDPLNCIHHFRAMVEIFKYNDEQLKGIRKSIAESKELKKILKRDQ